MMPLFDSDQALIIPTGKIHLRGILHVPANASGLVIFVHGSGSSRLSLRNQFVAKIFQQEKLATLLFDLLTDEEEALDNITSAYRFDIVLLAERLFAVTKWAVSQNVIQKLPIGYFGASTGAAAALVTAGQLDFIHGIVSRGGRPDMAMHALPYVKTPTLLIVGGNDQVVIEMNQRVYEKLETIRHLEIIPGATHLFEEPGTLHSVALLAVNWFIKYLKIQ